MYELGSVSKSNLIDGRVNRFMRAQKHSSSGKDSSCMQSCIENYMLPNWPNKLHASSEDTDLPGWVQTIL